MDTPLPSSSCSWSSWWGPLRWFVGGVATASALFYLGLKTLGDRKREGSPARPSPASVECPPQTLEFEQIQDEFQRIQDEICAFFVEDTGDKFYEEKWSYDKGTGGGTTRVWEDQEVLEKAGVNISAIRGSNLPSSALERFQMGNGDEFCATGVSLVIHPRNPHIPTIHANIRFFSVGGRWWFGGGIDLTPYYPVDEDCVEFHTCMKEVCERHNQPYEEYKEYADRYFTLRHRNEMRGIGGIFFDRLCTDCEANFQFVCDVGRALITAYRPILRRRLEHPYTEEERDFQLIRRGRYVEFNLIYDRGTKFGLESQGRTESILMSLPRVARWSYDRRYPEGTREHRVLTHYLQPQDWVNASPSLDPEQ